jgi:uncharacterized protein (TIGR02421 family)
VRPLRALRDAAVPASAADLLFERVAEAARERIAADRALRRLLPDDGRLFLDRALPFLAVYRRPPGGDDGGTDDLVTALAAHAHLPAAEHHLEGTRGLIRAVVEAGTAKLGGFLLLELWAGTPPDDLAGPVAPAARIHVRAGACETAEALRAALIELRLTADNGGELGAPTALEAPVVVEDADLAPPGLPPLDPPDACVHLGLELAPFWRNPTTGAPHPRVLDVLRREVARAVERAVFTFSQERTSLDPPHYRALGRQSVGWAARHVDRRLAEVYGAFDTLLQVTPVNTDEAWEAFKESGFERAPVLRYRPLPFDPERLKLRLFHVPIESVEDPLLNYLFREKQEELDREITLVRSLGTPHFRWASYQIHGVAEDDLFELARAILDHLPIEEQEEYAEGPGKRDYVDAEGFARAAHAELDYYRRLSPAFTGGVEILPDVTAGLMVSKGILCISQSFSAPEHRREPLLHHEVGTHVLTYSNGLAQPLKIFASGLAGYDALQEGLAVLAEYLCGGLTRARARVLAGRVVGVRSLVEGADFVETYRLLAEGHGFPRHTAFIITVRIHRGGGLTKDAQYLRGLRELMAYLRGKGTLEPLFVGKLGLAHIPAVQELVLRGVLQLPPVKPRWTSDLASMERLGACLRMDVMDLIETIER